MTPHPRTPQDDVDAELAFHLETRIDALVAEGLSREDARVQARREFGDVDDARSYMQRIDRRTRTARHRRDYVGHLRQDIVYALRRLRSAPAFTATALVTIALGIGANAAIFSVVNAVVFRPLPFPEPQQLYAVYSANRTGGLLRGAVSPPDLDDWRARRQVIEDIGGYWYAEGSSGVNLVGRGNPRRLSSVFITPGFLQALGVQASQGRLPREDELVRGGPDEVVLLTHGFWMREFGGDASVVGSSLTLNDRPYAVIGVLPPGLEYPARDADVFVPHSTIPDDAIPRIRVVRVLSVVARAKAGVTEDQVRTEMLGITQALSQEYRENVAWSEATVVPLADIVTGPVRQGLLVLLGAVGLVLLMACVNVAGLQLARALGRSREMAVRLALGAGRGRLIRQLVTESLVLATIGGAIGIGLARLGLDALLALGAGQLPREGEIALDGAVLGFAAVLSVATGLVFGIVPAIRASRGSASLALRDGDRGATSGGHRWRAGLIVAEVAVSMVLVVGAGLMGRSFVALTQVDAGFDPDRLLAVQFTLDADRYPARDPDAPPLSTGAPFVMLGYQPMIERVRALPGIVSAAAVKDAPYRGNGERNGFRIAGRVIPAGQDPPTATAMHVSEGYFATIGARMVEGREFTARDRGGAPFVVVVNEAFAREHFPGQRAAGQFLLMGGGAGIQVEIVGVVNDIRQVAVSEPAQPTIYLHNLQNSRVKTTIVARTAGDPLSMAPAVREAIWSVDPQQPITAVFTFDDAVGRALARPRLLAVLLGSFGLLGLALGAVGIYGLLSSAVNERRREIGVRLALGASPGRVLVSIVRSGIGITAVGVAIGLAAAIALSRFLAAVLYGVGPTDPATFAGTAAVLLASAGLASWIPARRAARLNPIETFRE